ncbi:hypothetical protein [Nocardia brasiliensis]|uniref:hypothetical protein n=1 Tax=Nocardia brasiliensis TaxID=37326 RepID=UPI00245733B4|nr:hypothetical protein [Nocardia brasiliensis]
MAYWSGRIINGRGIASGAAHPRGQLDMSGSRWPFSGICLLLATVSQDALYRRDIQRYNGFRVPAALR